MTGPLYSSTNSRLEDEPVVPGLDAHIAEEGQYMANAETFDPGPSFVENDQPVERLAEMPAWLQTFATQESTRDEDNEPGVDADEQPAMEQHTEPVDSQSDDVVLPDWLRDDRNTEDESGKRSTRLRVHGRVSGKFR